MKAALFDLDGTILDSKRTILRCFNTALQEFGYESFEPEELYPMIGMGLNAIFRVRGADRPELLGRYLEIHAGTFMDDMELFQGVPEMLVMLQDAGYLVGSVTMRRGHVARLVLDGMGLSNHFDVVVGADETPETKPSKEHVLAACRLLEVAPDESVMVGDTRYDVLSAKSAGAMAVGVTWGMGKRQEMEEAGADILFDSVAGLSAHLNSLR